MISSGLDLHNCNKTQIVPAYSLGDHSGLL